MDFDFDIGELERHRVHFHFNQFLGTLRISVDDEIAVKDFRMFDSALTKRYEFVVGEKNEKHDVAVEKARKRLNGGIRKQTYRVLSMINSWKSTEPTESAALLKVGQFGRLVRLRVLRVVMRVL